MATLKDVKRIVIKVGTSTLTHHTGKSNIRQIKKLVAVISDIVNSGVEVALVTSGAIGVGVGKLGLRDRPTNTAGKQAAATIGQCELMFMYDKMFAEFGHTVGQFLITKRDVDNDECRENLINAFEKTFEYGAIPIINENDAVAVEEIVFGDNDSLSAIVAKLIKAEPCKAWKDFKGHMAGDEGYKIYYPDGYVSWCPKDIFEAQYLEMQKEDTVTQEDVSNFIDKVESCQIGEKTTLTQVKLKNNFTIEETSSPIDAKNFDMKIGEQICIKKIENKVWDFLGFLWLCAKCGFKGDK